MLLGIDVWHGYGPIDWAQAKAAGVRFAYAKCTQGNDDDLRTLENEGKDPRFDEYVAGAKAAGIPVGAYLFGYPLPEGGAAGRTPEEQAQRFFADSKALGKAPGELPPALDLEWPARWDKRKIDANGNLIDQWQRWKVDAEFIARWGLAALAEIERLWGRIPVLYTYPDFWLRLGTWGRLPEWRRYLLWIATHTRGGMQNTLPVAGERPLVVPSFNDWTIWQFSADGSPISVPGVPACPLDRNVIKDEATLRRLLMLDPAPAPPAFLDLTTTRGVQARLQALGFNPGPIDGIVGAKTLAAIVAFQKSRKLVADGVVGPKTRAALAAG